jgi:hypothetical protein
MYGTISISIKTYLTHLKFYYYVAVIYQWAFLELPKFIKYKAISPPINQPHPKRQHQNPEHPLSHIQSPCMEPDNPCFSQALKAEALAHLRE